MIGGVGAKGINTSVSGAILAARFGVSCTCSALFLQVHLQQIQVTRGIGKASVNTSKGRARLAAHFLLNTAASFTDCIRNQLPGISRIYPLTSQIKGIQRTFEVNPGPLPCPLQWRGYRGTARPVRPSVLILRLNRSKETLP